MLRTAERKSVTTSVTGQVRKDYCEGGEDAGKVSTKRKNSDIPKIKTKEKKKIPIEKGKKKQRITLSQRETRTGTDGTNNGDKEESRGKVSM